MTQKPTIGRLVHYVLANGQHRAATVVNVSGADRANLTVHLDQMNDLDVTLDHGIQMTRLHCRKGLITEGQGALDMMNGTLAVGSAHQDEDAKTPGTWHWPEREA